MMSEMGHHHQNRKCQKIRTDDVGRPMIEGDEPRRANRDHHRDAQPGDRTQPAPIIARSEQRHRPEHQHEVHDMPARVSAGPRGHLRPRERAIGAGAVNQAAEAGQ